MLKITNDNPQTYVSGIGKISAFFDLVFSAIVQYVFLSKVHYAVVNFYIEKKISSLLDYVEKNIIAS